MCCVSGLEACACLAAPAALGCVCGLRPSVFLRADSTSQPAAAGSHQAAGNTHIHTLICTHSHSRPSIISMVISREPDRSRARGWEEREEGYSAKSWTSGLVGLGDHRHRARIRI